jgi:hypothetical protein
MYESVGTQPLIAKETEIAIKNNTAWCIFYTDPIFNMTPHSCGLWPENDRWVSSCYFIKNKKNAQRHHTMWMAFVIKHTEDPHLIEHSRHLLSISQKPS